MNHWHHTPGPITRALICDTFYRTNPNYGYHYFTSDENNKHAPSFNNYFCRYNKSLKFKYNFRASNNENYDLVCSCPPWNFHTTMTRC